MGVSAESSKKLPDPQLGFLSATLFKYERLLVSLFEGECIQVSSWTCNSQLRIICLRMDNITIAANEMI